MTIPQITVRDLKHKLDAGESILMLDVRNDEERQYCRIEPSQFIPLPELIGRVGEVEPDGGQLVVVYCHHGVRSLRAAGVLMQAGLPNVASLAGGIDAWSVHIDRRVPRY
jgi:adenylyltransferase/sulfurtransferase